MKNYLRLNLLPVCIESLFLLSCFFVPKEYYIYTNFLFYLALLAVFLVRKDLSLRKWKQSLKAGNPFWMQVVYASAGFICAFLVTTVLEASFPGLDTGTIGLKVDSLPELAIFAASTILLPPVTEEIFFRKNMIFFESRSTLVVTTLLGILLYSAEHSLTLWGIFLSGLWALPMCISYIKTRNIYVPMTAHFIGNLLGNGVGVVMMFLKLIS